MNLFLLLLLGHFLADYPLQPAYLVNWKNRAWAGISVHVLVHFLVMCGLVAAFSHDYHAYLAVLIIVFAHYIVDSIKAWSEKRLTSYFFTYWLDQIAHYLIAFLAVLPFWTVRVSFPPILVLYLIGALFSSFALEFSLLQFSRRPGTDFLPHQKPEYWQMLLRVLVFSGVFWLFLPH